MAGFLSPCKTSEVQVKMSELFLDKGFTEHCLKPRNLTSVKAPCFLDMEIKGMSLCGGKSLVDQVAGHDQHALDGRWFWRRFHIPRVTFSLQIRHLPSLQKSRLFLVLSEIRVFG